MMRAKADPKASSNTILIAACLLLAASVVGLLWPKPKLSVIKAAEKKQTLDLKAKIDKAQKDTVDAKVTVLSRTWTGEPSTVQAQVVNLTTALAKKHGVDWVRVQPQTGVTSGSLEQLPFLLVVEGPFPAVAALEHDLEAPENRLAISVFQLASTDSESNKVSASIGLVAHRVAPDVEEKKGNAKPI